MEKKKAYIIALIISVVLTSLLILLSDFILYWVSQLILLLEKSLTFSFSFIDAVLLGFIPFWSLVFYKNPDLIFIKKLIYRSILLLLSLTFFSIISFMIIYHYKFRPSMFSPQYLLYEPFPLYSTLFIGIALAFPPLVSKLFVKKKK